jgi:hypothetical protein
MRTRPFITLAIVAGLAGIGGAARVRPVLAAEQKDPAVVAVQVDGVLYSRDEYAQLFGEMDLHWVVDEEARGRGILIAFTSEENRDAAIESQRAAGLRPRLEPLDPSYQVCLEKEGTGGCRTYAWNVEFLGTYNDRITSVYTRDKAITLYEHAVRRGCSLYVEPHQAIDNLSTFDFCGAFTGSWNDKTSSIGREP